MRHWIYVNLTPRGRYEKRAAKRYAQMIGLDRPIQERAARARGMSEDAPVRVWHHAGDELLQRIDNLEKRPAVSWANIYERQAREATTVGNAASGQGRHALATELWSFAAFLREKAREERRRDRHPPRRGRSTD